MRVHQCCVSLQQHTPHALNSPWLPTPLPLQELSYEHAFGRKVRVNLETHRGRGRAGDLSQTFEKRPEDSGTFFKNIKDSSTYTR